MTRIWSGVDTGGFRENSLRNLLSIGVSALATPRDRGAHERRYFAMGSADRSRICSRKRLKSNATSGSTALPLAAARWSSPLLAGLAGLLESLARKSELIGFVAVAVAVAGGWASGEGSWCFSLYSTCLRSSVGGERGRLEACSAIPAPEKERNMPPNRPPLVLGVADDAPARLDLGLGLDEDAGGGGGGGEVVAVEVDGSGGLENSWNDEGEVGESESSISSSLDDGVTVAPIVSRDGVGRTGVDGA